MTKSDLKLWLGGTAVLAVSCVVAMAIWIWTAWKNHVPVEPSLTVNGQLVHSATANPAKERKSVAAMRTIGKPVPRIWRKA